LTFEIIPKNCAKGCDRVEKAALYPEIDDLFAEEIILHEKEY
jgi:hypothetical protein